MTNAAPIAPCPFCGSTDVATSETADERVYVFCGQCGSNGPTGVDAYASWRRLSELSAAPESVVPVVGTEARERLVERIYVAGGSEAERWEAEEAADDLIRAGWHDTPQVTGDMRERLERLRARGVAPTMTSEEHHDLMRGDPASAALAPPPDAIQAQAIEEAALDALRAYQQADEDGVMVLVSREALDMAIRALSPLPSGARGPGVSLPMLWMDATGITSAAVAAIAALNPGDPK